MWLPSSFLLPLLPSARPAVISPPVSSASRGDRSPKGGNVRKRDHARRRPHELEERGAPAFLPGWPTATVWSSARLGSPPTSKQKTHTGTHTLLGPADGIKSLDSWQLPLASNCKDSSSWCPVESPSFQFQLCCSSPGYVGAQECILCMLRGHLTTYCSTAASP